MDEVWEYPFGVDDPGDQHGTPSHRRLEAGDLVHVEVGGVDQRYHAVGLRTFAVSGAPPPAAGVRIHDVARRCLERGLSAVGAGRSGPGRRDAWRWRSCGTSVWGRVRDALRLRRRRRLPADLARPAPDDHPDLDHPPRTRHGVVLHACLLDERASVGVVGGGTYAVTDDGVEQLAGAGPVELRSS